MKKKILSLVLVAAMLSSLFVIAPVSGATEAAATVSLGDSLVSAAGETIEIDVILKADELLWNYAFSYAYDADKLTLVDIADKLGNGVMAKSAEGDTYKEVVLNSPYSVFTWSQTNNVGRDVSAGVVVATMVFTVNAGVSGEAKVELLNPQRQDGYYLNYVQMGASDNKVKYGGDVIAIGNAEASVLVLPEGYIDLSAANPADFTGDDFAGDTITKYNGSSTGTVIVPSQYPGMMGMGTVVTIADGAFAKPSFSTLVIPASVATIGTSSAKSPVLFGPANDVKVIVLNPNATFGNMPFYTAPGFGSITICGYADSTAEAYAKAAGFAFEEISLCNVTIDGKTFLAPTETTAPGMTENADGELVVAWTDGTNTYLPGQAMNLTGDVTLTAAKTVAKPTTSTDIDFKLAAFYEEGTTNRVENSDLSMRFRATFSIEDYATLKDLGTVQLGMLITPAKYVSLAGSFTKEALGGIGAANGAYIDVPLAGYYEKTATDYIFAARLANFSAKTLEKNPDFAAVMYATVTAADGTTFTVYGDFNLAANSNVKSLAQAIHDTNADLTNMQKGWLSDLIGSFN
ncbi:MAG: hypothetical protein E7609_06105 [Ruminococcaceae bacterium]|nr:hypothetical protein [Oscillospiraceae bacterium]